MVYEERAFVHRSKVVDQINMKRLSSFLLFLNLNVLKILLNVYLKSKFIKLEMSFKYLLLKDGLNVLTVPNNTVARINV